MSAGLARPQGGATTSSRGGVLPGGVVGRVLGIALGVVLGVVTGLGAAVLHRVAVYVGGTPLPWGLVLAVATAFAVGLAMRELAGAPAAVAFATGWVGLVGWLMLGRPEGDFLIANDALGWGILALGLAAMGVLVAISLSPPRPNRRGLD